MSYEFYKIAHVVGVIVLFASLGVLAAGAGSARPPMRRAASIAHGIAMAVIFVAGFGLLARLGQFGAIPLWAYLKIAVWLLLAVIVAPIRRRPEWAPALLAAAPVLGGIAIWLAVAKPF